MKKMNLRKKYNLQFFADKGEGGDGADKSGDDGDDDQDDADQGDKGADGKGKKSDKAKGKTYTQEEIDDMITERLKRERKKAEKKQEQAKDQSKDDKQGDKGVDKYKATDDKVSALEAKLLCFEHDVSKDSVSDVVALAKAYVDEDTDFEEAIQKVIKKYPQFVKGASKKKNVDNDDDDDDDESDNQKGSWGQRQQSVSKKSDGVEAAFLRKNPGLKID